MKTVQTVTGEAPISQLGHCQMHEHLFVAEGPATRKNPALLVDEPERSLAELELYRRAGGGSCLDAQPGGAGRDARVLREISRRSGVALIAVTGYHLPHFYAPTHWLFSAPRSALTDFFIDELRNGCVENREVRPGAVKAAVGPEGLVGAAAERYRAAAEAAARAEVPLVVHTEKGLDGVRAVELACACGMPVHRVLICHADRQAADFAPHEAIADTGAMLEYDTIGRFKYHDDEAECRLILHMLERGHERQLLFSLDTTRERLSSYGGAIGLNYILDVFLPMLAASGISGQTLRRITVDNPARVFE